jgi:hypothetical protein
MWLITYEAEPKTNSPEFGVSGGAYVNCWILYAGQDGAEALARYEVEKEWIIIEKVAASWYEPGDIRKEDDHWPYYRQATQEGGCFVFHYFPLEAENRG